MEKEEEGQEGGKGRGRARGIPMARDVTKKQNPKGFPTLLEFEFESEFVFVLRLLLCLRAKLVGR